MTWSDAARAAALEARRRHGKQRLFHGTSSTSEKVDPRSYWEWHNRSGKGTYLTNSSGAARLFAVARSKEVGGTPVVYVVRKNSLQWAHRVSSSGKGAIYVTRDTLVAGKNAIVVAVKKIDSRRR